MLGEEEAAYSFRQGAEEAEIPFYDWPERAAGAARLGHRWKLVSLNAELLGRTVRGWAELGWDWAAGEHAGEGRSDE